MPTTRLKLSNSKSNTWNRCHRKFEYKYVKKLTPKGKALPLERGTWLHAMLQAHYTGGSWKKVWRELKKEFEMLMIEEREELGDLPGQTKAIMLNYIRYYRKEDQRLEVIGAEIDEVIRLKNGVDFQFIIDLVVRDKLNGRIWLWDHKTVKSWMDDEYMLNDTQLARYQWCAEKKFGWQVAGVMFNEIRTKVPSVPELIKDGSRLSLKKIDTDYRTALKAINDYGLDPDDYTDFLSGLKKQHDKWFRRTPLAKDGPVTRQLMKELGWVKDEIELAQQNGHYPRATSKNCKWDCDYAKLCTLELHGVDASSVIKSRFDVAKPRDDKKEMARGNKRKKAKSN